MIESSKSPNPQIPQSPIPKCNRQSENPCRYARVRNSFAPSLLVNAHVGAVVAELGAGAQRGDAEQHDLGQMRGIRERTADFLAAANRVDPVHLVRLMRNARELFRRRAVGVVPRHRQQPRAAAIRVLEHLALGAHVEDAALAVQPLFVSHLVRLGRRQTAVVPRELDRRHAPARRELVVGGRRVWKRQLVERR